MPFRIIFKKFSIRTKLYLILGVLGFIILLEGATSLYLAKQMQDRINDIFSQEIVSLELLSDLKGALYRIRDRTLRLVDARTKQELHHQQEKIKEQLAIISKKIDLYDNTRLSKREKELLNRFKENLTQYVNVIENKIYPLLDTSQHATPKRQDVINKLLYEVALKEFRETREALNQLLNYQIERAHIRQEHAKAIFFKQKIIIVSALVLIAFLVIYLAKNLIQSIVTPLHKINEALQKIANNDLNTRILIRTDDEFSLIAEEINKNIMRLQSTLKSLDHISKHDSLTQLPNRKCFHEYLDKAMKDFTQKSSQFAIMLIDLDNFKLINDNFGHPFGDKLLKIVASRIRNVLKKEDVIARLGGDEFGVILRRIHNPIVVGNIANKIIDILQKPIKIDDTIVYITASLGIYIPTDKKIDAKKALSYADIAMYKAKKSGKNSYKFFDESMFQELQSLTILEHDIHEALERQEFVPFFQPIVELKTERILGFETLLRWKKGEEYLPPSHFIHVLESRGYIVEVTYQLIETVFQFISKNRFKGFITINLSLLQFYDRKFLNFVHDIQKRYPDVSPSQIVFELTETVFAENISLIQELILLIEKEGYKFALDDFGTGYSSLLYIKNYNLNTIKVDQSFIQNIFVDQKLRKLLDVIISMSKTLDIPLVLEGVEDKKTVDYLKRYRNYKIKIQGYYYFPPLPMEEVEAMIQTR
ncbi:EAL domain-containing protein [Nitratiruptor sp. SB155-2]|uniref:EAL domain-containing protein n=1 Tax=Nitratiruptor sp. (strain SB155-2) TaxID=387092 RepID=UPI0001587128|nr:EAL domain-containing protein [Nitratiruptor sp. SB155-2]BAF70026.1 signal transduction response regulator [Nitratiruptor sp. SB155-2]